MLLRFSSESMATSQLNGICLMSIFSSKCCREQFVERRTRRVRKLESKSSSMANFVLHEKLILTKINLTRVILLVDDIYRKFSVKGRGNCSGLAERLHVWFGKGVARKEFYCLLLLHKAILQWAPNPAISMMVIISQCFDGPRLFRTALFSRTPHFGIH